LLVYIGLVIYKVLTISSPIYSTLSGMSNSVIRVPLNAYESIYFILFPNFIFFI
jgi:hypothetical protein